MASYQKSHPLNMPGPLFTDTTCIDCGTCYHLGPGFFHENESDDKSVVMRQPTEPSEWLQAKRAILSCPTNSIGVRNPPEEFKTLGTGLPLEITRGVFYLGYTSRNSFGATSYLLRRDEGNVMVDSPRFHPLLVNELEKLGGLKYMFLSHQDDVADHALFHEHFGCERIIHKDDLTSGTAGCEIILDGSGPVQLDSDLKIIMTPGHTRGHMNLLFKNLFLFTGDHLFVDQEKEEITASQGVCWYSWPQQIQSTEKLLTEEFEWILPGHGGWGYFGSETKAKLQKLLTRMKA